MFADMELLGIPHSLIIGERNLDEQKIEYKHRATGEKTLLNIADALTFLQSK